MHKCLVADIRLAGMLDTHPCFISPFLFYLIGCCSRRWSLGVQEQEIPDADPHNMTIPDAYYYVEFPVSQAGGLAFSIVVFLVLAFLRQITCTLCLYSDTIASANFVLPS